MNNILLLILIILVSTPTFPQFDTVLFTKYEYLNGVPAFPFRVFGLGDQNNDGYDDILIYNCSENSISIYYGGNPMDTIPVISWILNASRLNIGDINNDGITDIIAIMPPDQTPDSIYSVYIYHGGTEFDTIPSQILRAPPGSKGFAQAYVLKDFNGDSKSELILYDPYLPNSNHQEGSLYFYRINESNQLDTIPFAAIFGDSVTAKRYMPSFNGLSSGDINGDGKTDFTLRGLYGGTEWFREFYLGNENYDLTPQTTFYQENHTFALDSWKIIDDINGDGKDDFVIVAYGNVYPYYYYNSILYGNFPIDTIQRVGINTQNSFINFISEGPITIGDINGDGYNDMLAKIGGESAGQQFAGLWTGAQQMLPEKRQGWNTHFQYISLISKVGDVNGDGLDDICVGQKGVYSCWVGVVKIIAGDTLFKAPPPVSVDEEPVLLNDFKLYSPYPNPFNPTTTIRYDLPKQSIVELTIYDILGRKIKALVNNELKQAGRYEVMFNASRLPSGVYFYRITAGDYVSTKKMLLIK